jgi:hypothetical protein
MIQMTVNNSVMGSLESVAFTDHQDPFSLVDMFVILGPYVRDIGEEPIGPYASECILRWCVKTYTAEANSGTFYETTTGKRLVSNPSGSSIVGLCDNGINFTVKEQ